MGMSASGHDRLLKIKTEGVSPSDRAASELIDRYWDRFLEFHPLFATHCGDERFDDRLPDPSESGLSDRERLNRTTLKNLAQFDADGLTLESRTALDMVESVARRDLAQVTHRFDLFWVASHMDGSYLFGPSQLIAVIGSLQLADTPERLDRYLARLSAVPTYLRGVIGLLQEGVSQGQTAPVIVVDRAIDMVEGLLDTTPEETPALEPLKQAGQPDRERTVEVVQNSVFPAFRDYLDALRRYRASARETIGLYALPDGDAMYASEILGWTTLPVTAMELHELGEEQLSGVREEERRIARQLGYEDAAAAIRAHTAAGKNTPSSRREVLDLAKEQVQRSWDAAPAFFGRLPRTNCEVRPVEEYLEAHILDYYLGPSADGSRPGTFYVNCASRPLHSMATTTYHEANPGHHFQIMIDLESSDRPPIRRFGNELQGVAFAEGWGLYSERLADEMGLFRDDYERLGMLELQALRAARLVVDTGIHALGWPRERAVALLEETGQPDWKAAAEVDRYIAMPGQALCYTLGQLEIERLRRDALRDAPDGRLALRAFHDRLLSLGALPLPTVRREMTSHAG
jgi:uncharacterized protein (DUF885 family)